MVRSGFTSSKVSSDVRSAVRRLGTGIAVEGTVRWYLTSWEDVHCPNFYCACVTEREKQISFTVKIRGIMVISCLMFPNFKHPSRAIPTLQDHPPRIQSFTYVSTCKRNLRLRKKAASYSKRQTRWRRGERIAGRQTQLAKHLASLRKRKKKVQSCSMSG